MLFPVPNGPRLPGTLKIPVAAHFGQALLFLMPPFWSSARLGHDLTPWLTESALERLGYPTQEPIRLRRVVRRRPPTIAARGDGARRRRLRTMVTRPASMASAGPVIKVMARLRLCRGPDLNRRHMVLQARGLQTPRALDSSALRPRRPIEVDSSCQRDRHCSKDVDRRDERVRPKRPRAVSIE